MKILQSANVILRFEDITVIKLYTSQSSLTPPYSRITAGKRTTGEDEVYEVFCSEDEGHKEIMEGLVTAIAHFWADPNTDGVFSIPSWVEMHRGTEC